METKLKQCSRCKKDKVIWKNKTIDGIKNQFCKTCYNIIDRDIKKEKRKLQREKKKEKITEKQLDSIFSKLVRNIYPSFCHSSGVPITVETSHASHLISRKNRCTRFDLANVYPCTPQENMFNQTHVIYLAKKLKEYYNIEFEEYEQAAKQNVCKTDNTKRKEMYDIFVEGLRETLEIKGSCTPDKEHKLNALRKNIRHLTKNIL